MTELLEHAIKTVKALPESSQDEIADVILTWIDSSNAPMKIPAEHQDAVREGMAQLDRGEFHTESQLRDLLKSF
jgi:predicted transcriptional regulator